MFLTPKKISWIITDEGVPIKTLNEDERIS